MILTQAQIKLNIMIEIFDSVSIGFEKAALAIAMLSKELWIMDCVIQNERVKEVCKTYGIPGTIV